MEEIVTQPSPHAALIAGLRELADHLEAHNVPLSNTRFTILNSVDADELAAIAAALGVEPKPVTLPGEDRPYSRQVDLLFGPVKLHSYALDRDLYEERVARNREADKIVAAACWVYACDDEPEAVSAPYPTEAMASGSLAAHAEGCSGAHSVRLVSGDLAGSVTR